MTNRTMVFQTGKTYLAVVDDILGVTVHLTFYAVTIDELGKVRYVFTKADESTVTLDASNLKAYFNASSYKDL
ncbi:MAG: hypothetical protein V7K67_02130 [Nostoc sp.]|uniref:hypothetical protein n=1 Tax=Nostoc sp. TaxID=1180 RepID=UPI002FF6E9B0